MGRGGACVPARVAPQGRIYRSSPAHNACVFDMETPLRGRSGGHIGTAPTVSFGWIARGLLVSFGWIACVILFVGKTVHMNQHHRCCTFDSPGLPTTGGYPGERRREGTYAIGIVLFNMRPYTLYFLICALIFYKIYPVVSSPWKMPLSITLQTMANVSIFTHRTPHFISLFS